MKQGVQARQGTPSAAGKERRRGITAAVRAKRVITRGSAGKSVGFGPVSRTTLGFEPRSVRN